MDAISMTFGDAEAFDSVLNEARKNDVMDSESWSVITKNKGTREGNPIAVITFDATIKGEIVTVQKVVTVANLIQLGQALKVSPLVDTPTGIRTN